MSKLKHKQPSQVRHTLKFFWREIARYKWYSLGTLILTPVGVFIGNILGPLVFAHIVNTVSSGLPADQIAPTLLPIGLTYLALLAVNNLALEKLRIYLCWKMELKAMKNLSTLIFDTISNQSMQFHSDHFSGSLVSQSNRFVSSFERFFDAIIWNLLPVISSLSFILIVLFSLTPLFALALLVLIIVYTVISGLTFHKISHLNTVEAAANSKQTGQLSDVITNILSVKSYAREAYERRRHIKLRTEIYQASMKLMHATLLRQIMFSLVNLSIIAFLIIFIIFGPSWFNISVATMVIIVTYSQQIFSQLWDINHVFKDFNRVFGDAREMTAILSLEDDVVDRSDAKSLKVKQGIVGFNHITYQHSNAKKPIFEDFNLTVSAGERIGLVGISGSGKTTLTKLLLRFADVSKGSITIDDQDISAITQKSLRSAIAYVPQETALFHRTIAENISYSHPSASLEDIKKAAKLANAHDFIMDLPEGYETLVGERGVKLSGGQRQRIAIARAILKDAPILVLDEATSALDSESETLIQDALTKLMHGRTSLVIAHRLSTVAGLDRIIVLKNGKIVEQGSHAELLKNSNGAYQKLWTKQSSAH